MSDLLLFKQIFFEQNPATLICFIAGSVWLDPVFDRENDPVDYSVGNIKVMHQMYEFFFTAVTFFDC